MIHRCPHCKEPLETSDLELIPVGPKGCICNTKDWSDPNRIPPVCSKYIDDQGYTGLCKNCEHEEGCHV